MHSSTTHATSFIDLTGQRFGRWTITGLTGTKRSNQHEWTAKCDCGTIRTTMLASTVKHGNSKSCGCLRRELLKAPTKDRHKDLYHDCRNPLYAIWLAMKTRCYNEMHPAYGRYGARGIKLDPAWEFDFETFVKDMGPRPSKHYSIERVDNNGDYTPENCKWGTRREQARNRKNNRLFEWKGKIMNLVEVCEMENVEYVRTYQQVFKSGWTIQKAVTTNQEKGRHYVRRRYSPDVPTLPHRNSEDWI